MLLKEQSNLALFVQTHLSKYFEFLQYIGTILVETQLLSSATTESQALNHKTTAILHNSGFPLENNLLKSLLMDGL